MRILKVPRNMARRASVDSPSITLPHNPPTGRARSGSLAIALGDVSSNLLFPAWQSTKYYGSMASAGERLSQMLSPRRHLHLSGLGQRLKRTKFSVRLLHSKPKVHYMVLADLDNGEKCLFTGEDGQSVKEILRSATTMEYRVQSYRVIMASTRAILNVDMNALMTDSLENVFEDIAEDMDAKRLGDEVTDNRYIAVQKFLRAERQYQEELHSIFDVYAEPLRKFSSLSKEDHRVLFSGIEPLLSLSAMLCSKGWLCPAHLSLGSTHTSFMARWIDLSLSSLTINFQKTMQLEDALKCWDPHTAKIGNIFSKKFFQHYDEYYDGYSSTKVFLEEKQESDDAFAEFCELRLLTACNTLETLLSLPVQRLPEYEHTLQELLDYTDDQHPDYDDITKALNRVKSMVKEREDELSKVENRTRIDNVQDRFPADDLHLNDPESLMKMRSLQTRRRSAPGAILLRSLTASKIKSSSGQGPHTKHMDIVQAARLTSSTNRTYIMEGPVQLTMSMQIQDRYLFLFNDLLLVAKPKSNTTFKLKHRVRLCEVWLASAIEEVAETSRPPERSFVIGWPTTNMVATFGTAEIKELWLEKLKQQIEEGRIKELPKELSLNVMNKVVSEMCSIHVSSIQTADDVISLCAEKFQLPKTEAKDYQLWVVSGKEESAYPLFGHELPYSIKMSHIRDISHLHDDPLLPEEYDKALNDAPRQFHCEFFIKHNKKLAKKHGIDEGNQFGKSLKKQKRSPLLNLFKRAPNRDELKLPPHLAISPQGNLFGQELVNVAEADDMPAKQIMNLLVLLYRHAPYTAGIFRKSANEKMKRELRQQLDDGEDCLSEEVSPLVTAALLKDYLKHLPDCLLSTHLYEDWIAMSERQDSPEKIIFAKQILDSMPNCHYQLLRFLMCVLYHIDKHCAENNMNAYNLSVCIAQSILWQGARMDNPVTGRPMATGYVCQINSIVQFLIENCIEVFGEELPQLLGNIPVVGTKLRHTQDSGTDSDSMHSVLSIPENNMRRDDSSIDSLERELYSAEMESSPRLAKSHLSPSNLSRDSGLTLSDNQLFKDDGNESESSSTAIPIDQRLAYSMDSYVRSLSTMEKESEKYEDENTVQLSQSLDSKIGSSTYGPIPPPRRHKGLKKEFTRTDSSAENINTRRQFYSLASTGHMSYNRSHSLTGDMIKKMQLTHLPLSKRISAESLHHTEPSHEFNASELRVPDIGNIIKSASGSHLFLDEVLLPVRKLSESESLDSHAQRRERLYRQVSLADSTPPLSPQSKMSYSSDSLLSDSSATFLREDVNNEGHLLTPPLSPQHTSMTVSEHKFLKSTAGKSRQVGKSAVSKRADVQKSKSKSLGDLHLPHSGDNSPEMQRRPRAATDSQTISHNIKQTMTSHEAEDILKKSPVHTLLHGSLDNIQYEQSAEVFSFRDIPIQYESANPNLPLIVLHRTPESPSRSCLTQQSAKSNNNDINITNQSTGNVNKNNSNLYESQTIAVILKEHTVRRALSPEQHSLTSRTDTVHGQWRPDRPPPYQEAVKRKNLLKHGGGDLSEKHYLTERTKQHQTLLSARAKQLYLKSLTQFQQGQKAPPIPEDSTSSDEEETDSTQAIHGEADLRQESDYSSSSDDDDDEIDGASSETLKDPKLIYEDSMKQYTASQNVERRHSVSVYSVSKERPQAVPSDNATHNTPLVKRVIYPIYDNETSTNPDKGILLKSHEQNFPIKEPSVQAHVQSLEASPPREISPCESAYKSQGNRVKSSLKAQGDSNNNNRELSILSTSSLSIPSLNVSRTHSDASEQSDKVGTWSKRVIPSVRDSRLLMHRTNVSSSTSRILASRPHVRHGTGRSLPTTPGAQASQISNTSVSTTITHEPKSTLSRQPHIRDNKTDNSEQASARRAKIHELKSRSIDSSDESNVHTHEHKLTVTEHKDKVNTVLNVEFLNQKPVSSTRATSLEKDVYIGSDCDQGNKVADLSKRFIDHVQISSTRSSSSAREREKSSHASVDAPKQLPWSVSTLRNLYDTSESFEEKQKSVSTSNLSHRISDSPLRTFYVASSSEEKTTDAGIMPKMYSSQTALATTPFSLTHSANINFNIVNPRTRPDKPPPYQPPPPFHSNSRSGAHADSEQSSNKSISASDRLLLSSLSPSSSSKFLHVKPHMHKRQPRPQSAKIISDLVDRPPTPRRPISEIRDTFERTMDNSKISYV